MRKQNSGFQAILDLPFSKVGIALQGDKLCELAYLGEEATPYVDQSPGLTPILDAIDNYMADPKHPLKLEMVLSGTDFQRRVWDALCAIPAGETLTYGTLAERLGSGARAVGNACRANPCPLLVPCHRVVASNGLGGFAGQRSGRKLEVKRWLLRHEGYL